MRARVTLKVGRAGYIASRCVPPLFCELALRGFRDRDYARGPERQGLDLHHGRRLVHVQHGGESGAVVSVEEKV